MGWFDSIRRTLGEGPDPSAWRAALGIQLDLIEAELRRLGWWQSAPASPEQMAFTRAFAADTMAFCKRAATTPSQHRRTGVALSRAVSRCAAAGRRCRGPWSSAAA